MLANKFYLVDEDAHAARVGCYFAGRAAESWAVFLLGTNASRHIFNQRWPVVVVDRRQTTIGNNR